jgi:hypothetical protein
MARNMKRFKIGKEYHYDKIKNAESDQIDFIEHDFSFTIGESFILLKDCSKDIVTSFVMISYNQHKGSYYKCIYNDTQNPVS